MRCAYGRMSFGSSTRRVSFFLGVGLVTTRSAALALKKNSVIGGTLKVILRRFVLDTNVPL